MSLVVPTATIRTETLPVDPSKIGKFIFKSPEQSFLGDWELELAPESTDAGNLYQAAQQLRSSDVPVAFPTETVYGLGADATRSAAVQGIYRAKQRPSDNPLIVHVCSLKQLRTLLDHSKPSQDSIPSIYHPLIQKFWPGPLTILLPLPTPSPFAPEVTAGQPTVAVRMPSSLLALALIHLTDRPLAAPSANASSRPSPTTAAHVVHDLSGRIETVLDGGSCDVGVESTIVDGLSRPPLILRPGAVSLDMLRECEVWQDVRIGYADAAESSTPRAPGMKYKHYSPQAKVILVHGRLDITILRQFASSQQCLGILRTRNWVDGTLPVETQHVKGTASGEIVADTTEIDGARVATGSGSIAEAQSSQLEFDLGPGKGHVTKRIWTIDLGRDATAIARKLFSALRELDLKGVEVIFVEALDEQEEDSTAAIMNRLRKAAEREVEDT